MRWVARSAPTAIAVGMLDDRNAWLGELERRPPGGRRVHVVVVGHRLAVHLVGPGDAGRAGGPEVQGRALVRVLPVAQHFPPGPERGYDVGPAGLGGGAVRRVDREANQEATAAS